jgi:ribulose-5-phosphate 4-epimerase/fuculose-1-phosphate aldolase
LSDPKKKIMVMGSHGIMVIGKTIADTFNRMYYFEKACATYIRALQTGLPLRVISDEIAESIASQLDGYYDQDYRHLEELKSILNEEGSKYDT